MEKRLLSKTWEKNKLFGNIKDVIWLSKNVLSKQTEDNIRCCINIQVNFFHPQNVLDFEDLIDSFQKKV